MSDTKYLKELFKYGYEEFTASRKEMQVVYDLYHNRHYTEEQLNKLAERGQPAETYNVIKMFTRLLVGYYSKIVNEILVRPVQTQDIPTASILTDLIKYVLKVNNFSVLGDDLKRDLILAGLCCAYVNVYDTGKKDEFGRPLFNIKLDRVPPEEIVLDPLSKKVDYSDARFIHRWKWLPASAVKKLFGTRKLNKLEANYNFLEIQEADKTDPLYLAESGVMPGSKNFKIGDNYLVVHTVYEDDNGDRWSVYWSGDTILLKEKITFKEVKFPYRIMKLHTSDKNEYYGIFREIIEPQKAINQAVLKIQLLINSNKAFVEEGAVENIESFANAFNRVEAVIPVLSLEGIKVEQLSTQVLEQYSIIDKALERIQRVLGINQSFLGMAFASDSGRKVLLQQQATITSLNYLTKKVQEFYRLLGWDIVNLAKQYLTAHQAFLVSDDLVGDYWIEINKPLQIPELDKDGRPIVDEFGNIKTYTPVEPIVDPATGEYVKDENGNLIVAPIPEKGTEIAFSDVDIDISVSDLNNDNEKSQILIESVINGQIGQMLAQVNPAGYFRLVALAVKNMRTRFSPQIAGIFEQTASMLQQAMGMPMLAGGETQKGSQIQPNQDYREDLDTANQYKGGK